MLNIIQNKKIYFLFSGICVCLSVLFLIIFGLKPGIDFTGGSLIEISFTHERPSFEEMQSIFSDNTYGTVLVQPIEENGYIFKMRFIREDERQAILSIIRSKFEVLGQSVVPVSNLDVEGEGNLNVKDIVIDSFATTTTTTTTATTTTTTNSEQTDIASKENRVLEQRFETIGSSVSAQLKNRSIKATIIVILAIILYIAYTFRKVSRPVKSWKYGVAAVIALCHDVVITMGVFALLGHYLGIEVDIPFVVALITILGYSVNDTIVVFDRIREKLIRHGYDNFEEIVNRGINETLMRSFNTSLTVLIVLCTLFLFGGESIRYFSLALIIGISFGTYSSIFLASPLLVAWEKWSKR